MEPAKAAAPVAKPVEVLSSESIKPEKKRKRYSSVEKKSTATTASALKITTPPPTSILILDNGGHTLKYGWSSASSPKQMPNITAKLQHQWTVLVGDELDKVQPNQLESTTRSTERGIVTNLCTQIQVWKRVLDDLGVIVPTTSEAAQVFGWKVARTTSAATILPQSCAVLLLVPPHCPRVVLEQILNIWFQEFHFGHVGLAVAPIMASVNPKSPCSCIVDMGWSAIHIVPTYRQMPPTPSAIRRMPLGGRHLVQLWKYYISYRQWSLMDQEFLLQAVQEKLGFVSLNFDDDLKLARRVPLGKRPYDREFVLPDYSTTYEGFVRVPPALHQQQANEVTGRDETATTDEEDEITKEEAYDGNNDDGDNGDTADEDKGSNDGQYEDEIDEDENEESDEAKRRRILRQRQEEERRRQEEEAERQVLMVSVERFTIPEVLFRPTDAGLDANLAGLPQAIVASISACPRQYQAIMYQSIRIVGGLAQLSNLKERIERELRSLAPCQYEVRVEVADSPIEQAWLGAKTWVHQKSYSDWSIRMDEWEASRKDSRIPRAWHRLLADNGGAVV